ncbi:hypothetical protein [uncultured Draconibacterium sp.]|nr:hypothetical protein [uncultured Draconibacterium sp.]
MIKKNSVEILDFNQVILLGFGNSTKKEPLLRAALDYFAYEISILN